MKRSYWSFKDERSSSDAEVEVTSGDQGVTIAVTQEKAVGSYNETTTCTVTLPADVALALGVWMIRQQPDDAD